MKELWAPTKGYEVTADIWNRWELVLKHEKANDFVSELLNNGYSLVDFLKVLSAI